MKVKEPSSIYYTVPKINALRNRIKENLDAIDNPQDLENLLLLTEQKSLSEETVLKLTLEMRDALQEGIDDYEKGRYIVQKEVDKEFERWMKEQ